ncbi:hypothetical protein BJ138DRAFT_1147655 [Hygrophoropsis aurantiaca]|uniref:Uncharacterized protein n=1 Tax=Hygrophoropsis aurantiaca TaxID=72124 RepID=A0ACB8AGL4_9AGAM|nr:hypothetical protein BJ138DRAFT_1147655 [Hygrophoropsis aurantiaca]
MLSVTNNASLSRATEPDTYFRRQSSVKPTRITTDFYLDTLFNPTWTSGPHVFTIGKPAATVEVPASFSRNSKKPMPPFHPDVRQNAGNLTSNPIAKAGALLRPMDCSTKVVESNRHETHVAGAKSKPKSSSSVSSVSPRYNTSGDETRVLLDSKQRKNTNITEMDDADFKTASKKTELVLTWPPDLSAYATPILPRASVISDESTEQNYLTDQNIAPPDLYIGSPTFSNASTEASTIVPSPRNRGERVPFGVLYDSSKESKEETLEKVVGLERLRRRAPLPLQLGEKIESGDDYAKSVLLVAMQENPEILHNGFDTSDVQANDQLSPLTAGIQVTNTWAIASTGVH